MKTVAEKYFFGSTNFCVRYKRYWFLPWHTLKRPFISPYNQRSEKNFPWLFEKFEDACYVASRLTETRLAEIRVENEAMWDKHLSETKSMRKHFYPTSQR